MSTLATCSHTWERMDHSDQKILSHSLLGLPEAHSPGLNSQGGSCSWSPGPSSYLDTPPAPGLPVSQAAGASSEAPASPQLQHRGTNDPVIRRTSPRPHCCIPERQIGLKSSPSLKCGPGLRALLCPANSMQERQVPECMQVRAHTCAHTHWPLQVRPQAAPPSCGSWPNRARPSLPSSLPCTGCSSFQGPQQSPAPTNASSNT